MSYCGICNSHDVKFTKVDGGWYCSGCDEIHYDSEMRIESAIRTLDGVRAAKRRGCKTYGIFDEDIDQALSEAIEECKSLGIDYK